MRIAGYGAGGVGGYFGGRLAQAGVRRALHRAGRLQALREHGLRVRSVKGEPARQAGEISTTEHRATE